MTIPFITGVNYWPRRKAMFWWSDFDAAEVQEEFAIIASLGMQMVRLFLLWEDWQPTSDSVSPACLKHLETVCDIAQSLGLRLNITFFTGHMSGPNWSPSWLLDRSQPNTGYRQIISGGTMVPHPYRNYFTEQDAWNAQLLHLSTVVKALHQHSAVAVWNLGNEPDLFAIAPDRETGVRWLREMTDTIKAIDPVHEVTCGLHVGSLANPAAPHINDAFQIVDTAVMHAYPMYVPWARGPLDPDFVPYCCALTSALCGKPTMMEEFGGCTVGPGEPAAVWEWTRFGTPHKQYMASEEDLATYLEAVLPRLVEVGATGALLWCYADYAPELWNRPPCDESIHERFFGLVRPDGSLKPHAEVIRRFNATHPIVKPATRTVTLDITPEEFYANPAHHWQRLYETY
jgi:endo-1,4-beta-mannosidase